MRTWAIQLLVDDGDVPPLVRHAFEQLAKTDPTNPLRIRSLFVSHYQLANVLRRQRQTKRALAHNAKALAALNRLSAKEQQDNTVIEWRRKVQKQSDQIQRPPPRTRQSSPSPVEAIDVISVEKVTTPINRKMGRLIHLNKRPTGAKKPAPPSEK